MLPESVQSSRKLLRSGLQSRRVLSGPFVCSRRDPMTTVASGEGSYLTVSLEVSIHMD